MVCTMRRRKIKRKSEKKKVDFGSYKSRAKNEKYLKDISRINKNQKKNMLEAGVDPDSKERSGTFIQINHSVVHSNSLYPGLEVMDITDALDKYGWLKNYYWNLISFNEDEFTKKVKNNSHHGYFLRAKPGEKAVYPLQSCLFLNENNIIQNVHNIIIAEENSELQVITGCARSRNVKRGLHIGISEIYVKKGAKLTFTMIHNWAEDVIVRPRTMTLVEEDGIFLSNYICLKPVKDVQMCPKAELIGKNSTARYNSIFFSHLGSNIDVGARVILGAEGSKSEIISRAVSSGGNVVARGYLKGEVPNVKAHLECQGLMLGDKGFIRAIPELEGNTKDVDMSHEAAIGKIAKEEIEYLMARGLTQSEAQAAIVRGFLDTTIMGLPKELQGEIDKMVSSCEQEVF